MYWVENNNLSLFFLDIQHANNEEQAFEPVLCVFDSWERVC